jgi:hypothetical protein
MFDMLFSGHAMLHCSISNCDFARNRQNIDVANNAQWQYGHSPIAMRTLALS